MSTNAQRALKPIEWLLGNWERTNAKPGRSGMEIWQKLSDTEWRGTGFNLTGADTSFVEKLKIIVEEGDIFYVSDVPENKMPIAFKLTGSTSTHLVFENSEHDFPKKISYELVGTKLKAAISGNGQIIEYWFEKKW